MGEIVLALDYLHGFSIVFRSESGIYYIKETSELLYMWLWRLLRLILLGHVLVIRKVTQHEIEIIYVYLGCDLNQ